MARAVPTFTLVLRNGSIVNFQSNNVKIEADAAGKLKKLSAAKKDNGLSLLYQDPTEVVTVLRDTSGVLGEEEYEEEESE